VVFCKYAVTLNAWLFPNTRQRVSEMCRHNGQSEIEKNVWTWKGIINFQKKEKLKKTN